MTETIRTTLARSPSCGAEARRLLESSFARRLPETALYDARTVLSELVNNAYIHGQGQIEVVLQLHEGRLRVEVIDEGQGAALEVRHEAKTGDGYGLRLVQALARAWGAHEGTTHVWAELDTA